MRHNWIESVRPVRAWSGAATCHDWTLLCLRATAQKIKLFSGTNASFESQATIDILSVDATSTAAAYWRWRVAGPPSWSGDPLHSVSFVWQEQWTVSAFNSSYLTEYQRWDQVTYVQVSSKSQVLNFKSQVSPKYFFLGQVKSSQVTGYVKSSQVESCKRSSQVQVKSPYCNLTRRIRS